MTRTTWAAATAMWVLLSGFATAQQSNVPTTQPDRATLETELAERLTNSRLTGYFTGYDGKGAPKADSYALRKVEKREGDKWLFTAVIGAGRQSMAIPLEVPVLWAGDTPVVSVTNFQIFGMGSYTARVVFYKDHYAGTWSSPTHGGYLWGRIEHTDNNATTQSSQPSKKPD